MLGLVGASGLLFHGLLYSKVILGGLSTLVQRVTTTLGIAKNVYTLLQPLLQLLWSAAFVCTWVGS